MASTDISAAVAYLTDAAHILHGTAPETSAHLMCQRANLLFHNTLCVSDIQRQHVCAACGQILIPGQGSSVKLERIKTRKKTKTTKKLLLGKSKAAVAASRSASGPCKALSCERCGRVTKTSLPVPEPAMRRSSSRTKRKGLDMKDTKPGTATTGTPTAASVSANASSKKRAKNRKAGLQALLSSQQQRQSNPLSLADFMMK